LTENPHLWFTGNIAYCRDGVFYSYGCQLPSG